MPSMKRISCCIFILILSILLSSCGKEVLTPLVNPVTISELTDNRPVSFSYTVDSAEVDAFAKNAAKFPVFGKIFQGIVFVLANTTISTKGGHSLDIEPMPLDLDTLTEIDFQMINWINLDTLTLQIDNAKKKDSLEFIERIEIYADLRVSNTKELSLSDEGYVKLVSFDKKYNKLDCNGRCLKLNIEKIDWKDILQNNKSVTLIPKITINSVPKSTMSLAGSVGFSIKFNLGF